MIVNLATDHAGLEHKDAVAEWLMSEGYSVKDHGANEYDATDDFNDYIVLAAEAVRQDPTSNIAIIFGGSGQGEAMQANRFPNVRAVVFYGGEESIPALSRQHNDSNVLSIGARFVDIESAKQAVEDWLNAEPLQDEKYQRRNHKLDAIFEQ